MVLCSPLGPMYGSVKSPSNYARSLGPIRERARQTSRLAAAEAGKTVVYSGDEKLPLAELMET